jgi:hypothetical protein
MVTEKFSPWLRKFSLQDRDEMAKVENSDRERTSAPPYHQPLTLASNRTMMEIMEIIVFVSLALQLKRLSKLVFAFYTNTDT